MKFQTQTTQVKNNNKISLAEFKVKEVKKKILFRRIFDQYLLNLHTKPHWIRRSQHLAV